MEELIQLITRTYGIAGLIMLSPFIFLLYVWRHTLKLGADLSRVQEQRVNDAKAVSDKMMALIGEQAGLNQETNQVLDQLKDLLMKITNTKR